MARRALLVAAALGTTTGLRPDASLIVGNVRVQALSDTLLRFEPKGGYRATPFCHPPHPKRSRLSLSWSWLSSGSGT